ncbi:FMN-dependent NADH-azoreductase [Streptomyces rubellomurinus]|uniref:FMN dependent NADH:quinone oxidoreductase n=1 Tax=Streptomyces rubellomurinus (strain ATCC 31215) TaxID=359131 RepID=A0A0F2T8E7_STRR3|nr:NAD(P)H-dependent oxidoreductase [Streptomyces rubellomurinus]KJS59468.1 NAD(P)H dehydrogenase [Streptomyces rubellomurinus]
MTSTTLLHLDSSISPDGSVSRALTARFASVWRARHGTAARHRHLDLAGDPVPAVRAAFDALGRRTERKGVLPLDDIALLARTPEEEHEWALARPLIEQLLAADVLLLGAPMYNFTVSTGLKAWIDRVTFPGVYRDAATGEALLRGTRVVLVAVRGGGYGPGTPREHCDFQVPYLRAYFEGLGIAPEHLHVVTAELTRAEDVPALHALRPLAVESLAHAEATLDALAATL